MAIKYMVKKLDGTDYEINGWDESKKFIAVLIRKDNQVVQDYNWYKTFAGAKAMCERWGYGIDYAPESATYYTTIAKGEVN